LNWKNTNPNPLEKLANNCLNIFFNNFGIKVKTQIDDINEINFIELQTKDGKDLDTKYWSTGTKQIIMRAVPLYQLKPHKAIILFDEAENSLYPDIQMNLIDFYTKLAIDSQFFFSTHSPLIASSFEPYEIVELKFDETYSSVYCEKYYKTTERHIDNYSIQPQYLSWDAILTNIFRLQVDGNPKRKEKLNELTEIGLRLRQLKAEGASNEKMLELWNKYQKLAELLNWKIA